MSFANCYGHRDGEGGGDVPKFRTGTELIGLVISDLWGANAIYSLPERDFEKKNVDTGLSVAWFRTVLLNTAEKFALKYNLAIANRKSYEQANDAPPQSRRTETLNGNVCVPLVPGAAIIKVTCCAYFKHPQVSHLNEALATV